MAGVTVHNAYSTGADLGFSEGGLYTWVSEAGGLGSKASQKL